MQTRQSSRHQTPSCFSRYARAVAVLAVLQAPLSQPVLAGTEVTNQNLQLAAQQLPQNPPTLARQAVEIPKIQLAIILDTSNSMDGLIDQTRNQLWQVVNQFSSARQNGVTPILEIALFEYGNDSNAENAGFVRMFNQFTRELDQVSAGLFSLTTNGGSEYCGFAIETVVNNLQWSRSDSDIKIIFIAGNESFTQGPVSYREAVRLASQQGITINTIHAGTHREGIDDGWQTAALLAGGDYMSIDADQQVVHVVAPQDVKIAELNAKINQTYVPYGIKGADNAQRQMEQDELSSEISAGLLAQRVESKSSSFYNNSNWDLVDALNEGEVDEEALVTIEDAQLPEPMQGLSVQEKIDYVQEKAAQRKIIKQEISTLSRLRAAFVAAVKRDQVAASPSISDALTSAVKKQARQKNFVFAK
jgi:hypothetical protein